MRRAALLGLVVCLLSAIPATAAIETGWSINLGNITGQGLTGVLTLTDVDRLTYDGVGHTSINPVTGVATTNALFYVTGVADGGTNVQSSTGETLNGSVGTTFQITFALTTTAQVEPPANGVTPFQHLPGGTLDIYVENTTGNIGKVNPNLTPGTGGVTNFTLGTQIAHLVDDGTGGGYIDPTPLHLNGHDTASFLSIAPEVGGLKNVLVGADGTDLLNIPNAMDSESMFAISTSDYVIGNNGTPYNLGPPDNWPAGWDSGSGSPLDFFFTEDGSGQFDVTPEPASVAVWGLLGLCAVGLARIRRKQ
jgi:MYXO-CTERM domain-containing protein